MKVKALIDLVGGEVLTPALLNEDLEISYGFSSDLMSDALVILNTIKTDGILEHSFLITGLATNQAVRTAEMLDVNLILMVRDKTPASKVIFLAEQANVCIIKTKLTMFNTAGLLYQHGIKGIVKHE